MVKTIYNNSFKFYRDQMIAYSTGFFVVSKALAKFSPIAANCGISRGSVLVTIQFRNFAELPKGFLNCPDANHIEFRSREVWSEAFETTLRVRVLEFRFDF